jgi:hypothetical protein
MSEIKIESDVTIQAKPVKKSRGRKTKTSINPASALLEALKFVAVAQKKVGTVQQQFCAIFDNKVLASNGVLTIGATVAEDLNACAHTLQLIDALSKVGEDLAITQLSQNALAVNSGNFKALVPCVSFAELETVSPDPKCANLGNEVKEALEACMPLVTEGAQHAHLAAVLLQAGSAVGTNGAAMVEYWHGFDMPPNMLIPKASAVAVAKCDKNLVAFGYSGSSITFWFEDDSFIKTQLFAENYINYSIIFEKENLNFWPVPDEFFKAVEYVESFSKSGVVYFENSTVASDEQQAEASTYKIEGLPEGMAFNSKYLILVKNCFKNVCFVKEEKRAFFNNEKARGVLMGIDRSAAIAYDEEIPY